MAKVQKNFIDVELQKLENKVKEFQNYLEKNSIFPKKDLSEPEQDRLHKEIVIQIKMQDAVFGWVPLLEKLRERDENKKMDTRGDVEINGLFRTALIGK